MCTAVSFRTRDHYFGRNLDLEMTYGESVTVTPRAFPLSFRELPELRRHHAILGMAHIADGYPLYYDAVNEHGLCMAGLRMAKSTRYHPLRENKENLAPFELIPYLLGQCADVKEAHKLLSRTNLVALDFSPSLPLTPLHFMLSDKESSLCIECRKDGLHVFSDPVGVLTNEPPFEMQLFRLNDYMGLSAEPAENRFCPGLALSRYSLGMGALGLPGDLTSSSRYVRAAFTKLNSVCGEGEAESVAQVFHILGSVSQTKGCSLTDSGAYEITQYSACINASRGLYYYRTYENSALTCVDLFREDLEGNALVSYPLTDLQTVSFRN